MRIGVPKEIKVHESRVGLTPVAVRELVANGHQVMVQKNAGFQIDLGDYKYLSAGAEVVETPQEIYANSDLIVKVKEPQPSELPLLREDQVLFTYLHLAPDPAQTEGLVKSGCIAIAYETVTDNFGGLPLLSPMSEVAGRMAIQAGAHALELDQGGRGMLLGGVSGVPAARVVIIGGGVSQVGDILTVPIRQAVRERAMRASEQSVRITTGMLGRRSILIGATVQAVNIAVHVAAENKNSASKETVMQSLEAN